MSNQIFNLFMLKVFHNLNPIHAENDDKIFGELQDVDMVIFVMKGSFGVGYEINYEENMKIKFS